MRSPIKFLSYFGRTQQYSSPSFSELARKHPSDKWTVHHYEQPYSNHLGPFRSSKFTLLEIGIGGWNGKDYSDRGRGGDSLRFWKEYFEEANIVGVDIVDKMELSEDRISIFTGSQTDQEFLREMLEEIDPPLVIIDDGSHINADVIQTFKLLFPSMKNGGVYVVEDTQTSYWPNSGDHCYGGQANERNSHDTIMGYFKSLCDGLNHAEFLDPSHPPTYFDKNILSIHFYHNIIFIVKGENSSESSMVSDGKLP